MVDDEIIQGLDGLEDAIKQLDLQTSQKALKNAMMYGSKSMLDDMKATTPIDNSEEGAINRQRKGRDHLVTAIKRRSKKSNGKYAAQVSVGVFSRKHGYIAAMLNFGTKYLAPLYWLNKSADRTVDTTISRFADKLRKNIEKAKK